MSRTPIGVPTPWAGRAASLNGSLERRLPIRGYVSSALRAVFEGDGLDLAVLVEGFVALFAAVPALFEAAEGELDAAAGAVGVDVDLTGAQLVGEPVSRGDVAGPDGGDQAVVRAVGDAGGLLRVVEGRGDQHGAEDLLPRDPRVPRSPIEEGGLEEDAAAYPLFPGPVPPRHEVGLPPAGPHVALDA